MPIRLSEAIGQPKQARQPMRLSEALQPQQTEADRLRQLDAQQSSQADMAWFGNTGQNQAGTIQATKPTTGFLNKTKEFFAGTPEQAPLARDPQSLFREYVADPIGRTYLGFIKGTFANSPELANAFLQKYAGDGYAKQLKGKNFDEVIDELAATNRSGFEKLLADIGYYTGALAGKGKAVLPKSATLLDKAFQQAIRFGVVEMTRQGTNLLSENINPEIKTEYGGATAVAIAAGTGAFFSALGQGANRFLQSEIGQKLVSKYPKITDKLMSNPDEATVKEVYNVAVSEGLAEKVDEKTLQAMSRHIARKMAENPKPDVVFAKQPAQPARLPQGFVIDEPVDNIFKALPQEATQKPPRVSVKPDTTIEPRGRFVRTPDGIMYPDGRKIITPITPEIAEATKLSSAKVSIDKMVPMMLNKVKTAKTTLQAILKKYPALEGYFKSVYYDNLVERANANDKAAIQKLNDMNPVIETYEDLLAKAEQGDQTAIEKIQQGQYQGYQPPIQKGTQNVQMQRQEETPEVTSAAKPAVVEEPLPTKADVQGKAPLSSIPSSGEVFSGNVLSKNFGKDGLKFGDLFTEKTPEIYKELSDVPVIFKNVEKGAMSPLAMAGFYEDGSGLEIVINTKWPYKNDVPKLLDKTLAEEAEHLLTVKRNPKFMTKVPSKKGLSAYQQDPREIAAKANVSKRLSSLPSSAGPVASLPAQNITTEINVEKPIRREGKASRFPGKIIDTKSLESVGNQVAKHLGISDKIVWHFIDAKNYKKTTSELLSSMDLPESEARYIVKVMKEGGVGGTSGKIGDEKHIIIIKSGDKSGYLENITPGFTGRKVGIEPPSQSALKRAIVHELGHIANPIEGGDSVSHNEEFVKWVESGIKSLYTENMPPLTPAPTPATIPPMTPEKASRDITPQTNASGKGGDTSVKTKTKNNPVSVAKAEVENHPIYQEYKKAFEDKQRSIALPDKIDFGSLRTEAVEATAGRPKLRKYVGQAGQGKPFDLLHEDMPDYFKDADWLQSPGAFFDFIGNIIETNKNPKVLNKYALQEALKSNDIDFLIAFSKYDMLKRGFSESQIQEEIDLITKDFGNVQRSTEVSRETKGDAGKSQAAEAEGTEETLVKEGDDFSDFFDFTDKPNIVNTPKDHHRGGFIDLEGPAKTLKQAVEISKKLARRIGLKGKLKDLKKHPFKPIEAVAAGVEYGTAPISYRLEKISPRLSQGIRRHSFDVLTNTDKEMRKLAPLFNAIKITGSMSSDETESFFEAIFSRDFSKAQTIADKNGFGRSVKDARVYLDESYQRGLDNGLSTRYKADYWPQRVKDMQGLLEYLFEDQNNRSLIEDARRNFVEKNGRVPTDREMSDLINVLIRGYKTSGVVLNKPGFSKTRRIEYVDKDLRDFYYDPITALRLYIFDLETQVANNQFFGRVNKEFSNLKRQESTYRNRIAKYDAISEQRQLTPEETKLADNATFALDAVLKEIKTKGFDNPSENAGKILNELLASGEIKPGQDTEAQALLKSYFNPARMNTLMRYVLSANYLGKLGNSLVLHNITQAPEAGLSYLEDWKTATQEVFKAFTGKSELKGSDLAFIRHIGEEFNELGLDEFVTKWLGITMYTDKPSKVALVNTAIRKARKLAQMKNPPEWFIDRLKTYHGEEWRKVLLDFMNEENTDDVLFYGFSRLSDRQPVSKAEQSQFSLDAPNFARPALMFKTFTLRRFYSIFNDARREWKAGRKTRALSITLAAVSLLYALDLGGQVVKDWYRSAFSGKKPKPITEQAVDTALRNFLVSRYQIEQLQYKGLEETMYQSFIPDTFASDVWEAIQKKNAGPLIRNTPGIGQELNLMNSQPTRGSQRPTRPQRPQRPQRQR